MFVHTSTAHPPTSARVEWNAGQDGNHAIHVHFGSTVFLAMTLDEAAALRARLTAVLAAAYGRDPAILASYDAHIAANLAARDRH
jgi:hypothetical protein